MIDRDIKIFILRALLAARGATPQDTLKGQIVAAFPNIAHTAGDLQGYIKDLEDDRLVAGTNDPLLGPVWDLTPTGKIKAQQLR